MQGLDLRGAEPRRIAKPPSEPGRHRVAAEFACIVSAVWRAASRRSNISSRLVSRLWWIAPTY